MRKRLWHALIISALLAVLLPASLAGIGQPVLAAAVPAVTTEAATDIGTDSATLNGTITDTGGENADIRGFDYGATTDYGSEVTETGSFEVGSFSQVLSGLSPETTYYYRAKAHNSAGWSYGAALEFTTEAEAPLAIIAPAVTTEAATSVGTDSTTLNGTITDTGGENADIRGFDYGTTTDYGSEVTETGSFEVGAFSQVLTGLNPETTYHFRAKAHNSAGWSYGDDMEFTTGALPPALPVVAPAVTTEAASSIATDSATLNGSITDTGAENADIRGFDYGLTTDYGTEVTETGSFGSGPFSRMLAGFSPATTYHFRAKAHNSAGWSYGAALEFTTEAAAILVLAPTVATEGAAEILEDEATLIGSIIDTGGEDCDLVGFEYGLGGSYGFQTLQAGSFDTGSFSLVVSGLEPGVTYHFRAKAHNSAGWSYGTDMEFTSGGLMLARAALIGARAVSYVGNWSNAANNPTSNSFSLPVGWAAGDVAVFWWYTYTNTKTLTAPSGVTQKQLASSAGYGRIYIGYRVLQTGDTTFAWTSSNSNNSTTIWGTSVFSGVDTLGDPFEAQSGAPATFLNQQNPNPPAVTTVSDNAWVVPIFGKNTEYTGITVPANYTTAGSNSSTAGNDASAGVAYRQIASHGTEDPGAWTLVGGDATGDGYVWTGALKPKPPPNISVDPTTYDFLTVDEGSTTETGLTYFTITNSSSYAVNITISATNMTTGNTWTLSGTATPGSDIYGLKAGLEGGSYSITVTTGSATLKSGLAASGTQRFGLQFLAPTVMSDNTAKSGTVTLTASY